MNIITLDDLRARIHEVGLDHHTEALLNVAAPAIRLTAHKVKEDTPLGATRLGGLPDLPPGVYFYEAETYEQVIPQDLEALHTGALHQRDFYRSLFPLAGGVTDVSG